jgi:hypothetical protein
MAGLFRDLAQPVLPDVGATLVVTSAANEARVAANRRDLHARNWRTAQS